MQTATLSKNGRIDRPALHATRRHDICLLFWCAAPQQQRPRQRGRRSRSSARQGQSITAPLCAACGPSWRAYEASSPAACGTTDRARAPARRLRCNQDADPDRAPEAASGTSEAGRVATPPGFGYMVATRSPESKRPTPEDWPKCLILWCRQ